MSGRIAVIPRFGVLSAVRGVESVTDAKASSLRRSPEPKGF